MPGGRRSHCQPTPRGGGLAIVATTLGGIALSWWFGTMPASLAATFLAGGLAIAAIGIWEDYSGISRRLRLLVQTVVAIWVTCHLPGTVFALSDTSFLAQNLGHVTEVISLVWLINLYNFMDGIDGLAASESIFVAIAATLLLIDQASLAIPLNLLAAGATGFLIWNWPPARIFMGDSGSCFIGFVLGVTALACFRQQPQQIGVWLILLGVFLIDATITLMRRVLLGQKWYEPHRSHAYQRLSQRWHSHAKVTSAIIALNIFWLLPCAAIVNVFREHAGWVIVLSLAPLACVVLALDAGRAEPSAD